MAYFDRFDICEAWYAFASDWHGGQWSEEYRIFSRLQAMEFKPAPSIREHGFYALTDNGKEIYNNLVSHI